MSKFTGFCEPNENWSKLPHQLIASLPVFTSKSELSVVLYVLRHTWGFREYEDYQAKKITTDEFINGRKRIDGTRLDNGIGMSKPSIYSGLSSAVEHGFLRKLVDNSDLGRVTHYYFLRTEVDADQPGIVYAIDPDLKQPIAHWHNIPNDVRMQVYKRSQGRCSYCDRKSSRWHYDHIYPQSRGGSDKIENLALACPQCNLSKNDRTPAEWGNECYFYDENDCRSIYGGWVELLPDDVKKLYPPLSKSFTPPSKEVLHRTEKETKGKETKEIYLYFLSLWKQNFPDKPQPRANNSTLQGKLKTRLKKQHFRDNWEKALERASWSDFLKTGGFFDAGWFLKNDDHYEKCLNGNYDNRQNGNGRTPSQTITKAQMQEEIEKAIQVHGRLKWNEAKASMSPLTLKVLDSMGNWYNVCSLRDGTEFNVAFHQACNKVLGAT